MRPVSRHSVNKSRSAKKFRKGVSRSKVVNFNMTPFRGGYRM